MDPVNKNPKKKIQHFQFSIFNMQNRTFVKKKLLVQKTIQIFLLCFYVSRKKSLDEKISELKTKLETFKYLKLVKDKKLQFFGQLQ